MEMNKKTLIAIVLKLAIDNLSKLAKCCLVF